MKAVAVVVAGGRGVRAGGALPKQYQSLAGQSVLSRTLAALAAHPALGHAIVVRHAYDAEIFARCVAVPDGLSVTCVTGGETRDASVRAGLAALPGDAGAVLIHDAARPLVSRAVIDRVLAALEHADGAAPALAVSDALWRGGDGRVVRCENRAGLWRAQTPQGFRVAAIRAAHAACTAPAADDVEVAIAHGLDIAIVEGDEDNLKITRPGDLARAEAILGRGAAAADAATLTGERTAMDIRTGNGFDVHRFGPGDGVVLCGVTIPYDRGLDGHSDADVGMHALTDAIYGALAEGDIGRHFPPSDPRWKGADSRVFLAHAAALAAERGYALANADCTLICEAPRIGPHAEAMRDALAAILGIERGRVSVKATTSERLGFTGRGEGIAALASVTLTAVASARASLTGAESPPAVAGGGA